MYFIVIFAVALYDTYQTPCINFGYISVEFSNLLTYVHLFIGYNLVAFSVINWFWLTIL